MYSYLSPQRSKWTSSNRTSGWSTCTGTQGGLVDRELVLSVGGGRDQGLDWRDITQLLLLLQQKKTEHPRSCRCTLHLPHLVLPQVGYAEGQPPPPILTLHQQQQPRRRRHRQVSAT